MVGAFYRVGIVAQDLIQTFIPTIVHIGLRKLNVAQGWYLEFE